MEPKPEEGGQSAAPKSAVTCKANFSWARRLKRKAEKAKPFSVVTAKRAMVLLAGQGKEPAALKVAPDGSFCIELVHAGKPPPAPDENPWDKEVL